VCQKPLKGVIDRGVSTATPGFDAKNVRTRRKCFHVVKRASLTGGCQRQGGGGGVSFLFFLQKNQLAIFTYSLTCRSGGRRVASAKRNEHVTGRIGSGRQRTSGTWTGSSSTATCPHLSVHLIRGRIFF
jgi:hypothetical protein